MGIGDMLGNLGGLGEKLGLNLGGLDVGKLLSADFLKQFTKFSSLNDLLAKVGVNKPEDLLAVNQDKLDGVIKQNSSFGNWMEMLSAAKEHLSK